MVRHGYAWIGSTYRRGGYGVRMAAEDTDNSRKIFWSLYGRPDRTLLHGQSWGGNVAAKASELYIGSAESGWNYDGVLITNGIVSGGTRAYGFRADLRAVYQFYCANHPAADEPAYPVWQGLPLDSRMTRAELRRRIETCTGVDRPADRRTPDQAARLRDILAVTGVAEAQLVSHMTWATFLFQDMVLLRLDGRNPFDNSATVYSGSSDDAALNAGVQRFSADPEGVAMLAHDADLSGQITRPTLTLHALHDPTVSVAVEAIYAATVSAAGRSEWLVQVVTDESDHSKLSDASYMTALDALEGWIDRGLAPDPASFQARCGTNWVRQGPCLFIAP
jgi:alpha-beta hydrolase superfamily lysophospholipase